MISQSDLAALQATVKQLQSQYGAFSGGQSMQAGIGAPTVVSTVGSLYYRRDTNQVYVSQGGGTWVLIQTGAELTAGVGVNISSGAINLNAFDHTGAALTGYKIFTGTATFSAASSVAVSLPAASFASATSFTAIATYNGTRPAGINFDLTCGNTGTAGFTIYSINWSTNTLVSINTTCAWQAMGT